MVLRPKSSQGMMENVPISNTDLVCFLCGNNVALSILCDRMKNGFVCCRD